MTNTTELIPLAPDDALLGAAEPAWLADLRRAGLTVYRRQGLPTVRVEAWKYTGLDGLRKTPFLLDDGTLEVSEGGGKDALDLQDAYTVTLVNGRPARLPDDLPSGVRIAGLAHLLASEPELLAPHLGHVADLSEVPMGALNAAQMSDGVVVLVEAGLALDRPLHVISVTEAPDQARHLHPRHVVVLGEGADVTLVESRVTAPGAAPTLANTVMEIALADRARLRHLTLVGGGAEAVDLTLTEVSLAAQATYDSFTLTLGGHLVRNEGRVRLRGAGAHASLRGAYGVRQAQHVDTTLLVDHMKPDTVSEQVFKGVVDAGGRGVFQGKTLVRRDAQHTDGSQLHKALLLSREAEVYAKPELEIYADDVKCGHGATAGELDQDQLFYLMARGIAEADARALLVEAFLDDVVEAVPDGPLRDAFLGAVRAWQARRHGVTWEDA